MKVAAPLLVGSLLVAAACVSPGPDCAAKSQADLAAIAASHEQCNTLSVLRTQLKTLDGAQGIRGAVSVFVSENDQLRDTSAFGDVTSSDFIVQLNPALTTVAVGPVGPGQVTIERNSAREIYLQLKLTTSVYIEEPSIETVDIGGTPEGTTLVFGKAIPSTPSWDVERIHLTSLQVIDAPALSDAADLKPLGVAHDLVGVYGCALQPGDASVDAYFTWLQAGGFTGTLEVCPHQCDANPPSSACPDNRPPEQRRAGCRILGAGA